MNTRLTAWRVTRRVRAGALEQAVDLGQHGLQRAEQEDADGHGQHGGLAVRIQFRRRCLRTKGRNFMTCSAAHAMARTPFSRWCWMCARSAARGSWVTITIVFLKSRFSVSIRARISSALLRVEVAGGLVRHQHLGVGHDGARDGHALLLAARELPRVVADAVGQAHHLERGERALAALLLATGCVSSSGSSTFSTRGEHGDQVVELEDEADVAAAPAGELALRELRHVGAGHDHLARRGPVDAGDQVEQRRLARARRAHQGHELALRAPAG